MRVCTHAREHLRSQQWIKVGWCNLDTRATFQTHVQRDPTWTVNLKCFCGSVCQLIRSCKESSQATGRSRSRGHAAHGDVSVHNGLQGRLELRHADDPERASVDGVAQRYLLGLEFDVSASPSVQDIYENALDTFERFNLIRPSIPSVAPRIFTYIFSVKCIFF